MDLGASLSCPTLAPADSSSRRATQADALSPMACSMLVSPAFAGSGDVAQALITLLALVAFILVRLGLAREESAATHGAACDWKPERARLIEQNGDFRCQTDRRQRR